MGLNCGPTVAGDVGVGDGHAVDGPRHLVAAAHVQLVVHHVRAGHEVGDHLEAGAGIDTGVFEDLLLRDADVAARRIGVQVFGRSGDRDLFLVAGHRQLVVKDGRLSRDHGEDLGLLGKARGLHRDRVLAQRHGAERELAVGVGLAIHFESRVAGLQHNLRAADRVVGGIVDDAAHIAIDSCPGRQGRPRKQHGEDERMRAVTT